MTPRKRPQVKINPGARIQERFGRFLQRRFSDIYEVEIICEGSMINLSSPFGGKLTMRQDSIDGTDCRNAPFLKKIYNYAASPTSQ
ncbi:MAG: hypothetical protein WBK96_10095 [Candidatus Manganitrophaceae bacterium]